MHGMIELNDIPAPVLDEIKAELPNADYSEYGHLTDETVSRRLSYRLVEPLTETVKVLDTDTFENKEVDGTTHQYYTIYLVRLNEADSTIRQVVTSGRIIGKKDM